MPNRMLRDTTDSEAVNMLSPHAEVMFYRLMMKADDYGVFHAKSNLLKAALFPLRLEKVRETDISRWMDELLKAGLIAFYEADSKPYLVIKKFGQRMRNMKKRFPSPPPQLLAATCRDLPPEVEVESEVELEPEVGSTRAREEIFQLFVQDFHRYFPNESAKLKREKDDIIAWKDDCKIQYAKNPQKLEELKVAFDAKIEALTVKKQSIVEAHLEKFWNHYSETGWKTKNDILIVDRVASFKKWLVREKEFAK